MSCVKIGNSSVGINYPTYFIADISANHDGSLDRAKNLIQLAVQSGANAAKFQNFRAPKIVSHYGFTSLGGKQSHQCKWGKSVYDVYQDASLPWDWTETLKTECAKLGIEYFSTPYDFDAINMLEPYVPCFKIGSGDITWLEMLKRVSEKGKPVLLATGASDMMEVKRAVDVIKSINQQLILMQCNTNYTGKLENFKHVNLNVLKSYESYFPDLVLGFSDHTPGHSAVLGAVTLGARVIEKHFTDDIKREGPDHSFSMTPDSWRVMVDRTRELEMALGSKEKFVSKNEEETIIIQRRCLRAISYLKAGTILNKNHIDVLRPSPRDAIFPYELSSIIGAKLLVDLVAGDYFRWSILDPVDKN